MKNKFIRTLVLAFFVANVISIGFATAKEYVIKASSPTVTNSMKPAIKYYNEGNYTQAMVEFENLLKKEPDNAYANYYLALIYTRLGEKESAERYYNRVITQNSNMSLRYYSEKALACLDDPYGENCKNVKSVNKPERQKEENTENQAEDDDMTKFIKSGRKIHPAAADAITKERMERKIQAEEYLRKQQTNSAQE